MLDNNIGDRMRLNRKEEVLIYTIISRDTYVTSSELSKVLDVSIRTIKTWISKIIDDTEIYGIRIFSKHSQGYSFEITNEESFYYWKKQLAINFNYSNGTAPTSEDRRNEIMRMLIFETESTSISNLKLDLFTSSSSFRRYFDEAIVMFKKFNLEIVKSNDNYKLEGSEISRRMCAVELYDELFHKSEKEVYSNENAIKQFTMNKNHKLHIRYLLLKVLRDNNYSLIDTHSQRLSLYLILLVNRHFYFPIHIEQDDIPFIKKHDSYIVANQIVEKLSTYLNLEIPENETISIAIILMQWIDYGEDDKIVFHDNKVKLEVNKIYECMMKLIKDKINIDLDTNTSKDYLCKFITPLIFKLKYRKYFTHHMMSYHATRNDIRDNILLTNLSNSVLTSLQKDHLIHFSNFDIIIMASILLILLNKHREVYKKRNVIIANYSGKRISEESRNILLTKFGDDIFESIEVYEFYEIRNLDPTKYDCVIMSFPDYTYTYEIPFLKVGQYLDNEDIGNIYRKVVLKGYDFSIRVKELNLDNNLVFSDFDFNSIDDLINSIAFRVSDSPQVIKSVINDMKNINTQFDVFENVLFLTIDRNTLTKNHFNIYTLVKPILYENLQIKYVIFVTLDYANNILILNAVNKFLSIVLNDKDVLKNVIRSNNLTESINLIREFM